MVAKKQKAGKKVKSLGIQNLSAKKAKWVKGGRPSESLGPQGQDAAAPMQTWWGKK